MYNSDWVHFLREQEVEIINKIINSCRDHMDKPVSVLEIGGGDGFMASQLKEKGFNITCTEPDPRKPQFHSMVRSNAYYLPFENQSYDFVYTSNVLEHIDDISAAFSEMERVLKNNGIMIHSMPTVACSLMTTLTSPFVYPRSIVLLLSGYFFKNRNLSRLFANRNLNKLFQSNSTRYIVRKIVITCRILNPLRIFRLTKGHGIAMTPFHEIYAWRKKTWVTLFRESNCYVNEIIPHPLSASMNKLFGMRLIRFRRFLSKLGFQSSNIYVLNFVDHTEKDNNHTQNN
jgi:ubiquinone/menaquinone biosynthesis C-methylase UbiE